MGIDILIVGDSLTAMELRNNTCMTGPAAQILKDTMQKVGLPTAADKVAWTVALKEAIPKTKGYKVSKEVMERHRKRLLLEIQELQPKYILTLGKTSFQVLSGDYNCKITSEYAKARTMVECGEATIIPIMHPALIIRAPGDYKPFLAELELVNSIYHEIEKYDTGKPSWIVLNTEQQCDEALEFLKDKPRIAADIETTSLDYRIAEFCVMGMCFEKNKIFIIPRELQHRAKDFFALPNIKWTWHHGE